MKQVELMLLLQDQLDAEDKTLYHVRRIEDEVGHAGPSFHFNDSAPVIHLCDSEEFEPRHSM